MYTNMPLWQPQPMIASCEQYNGTSSLEKATAPNKRAFNRPHCVPNRSRQGSLSQNPPSKLPPATQSTAEGYSQRGSFRTTRYAQPHISSPSHRGGQDSTHGIGGGYALLHSDSPRPASPARYPQNKLKFGQIPPPLGSVLKGLEKSGVEGFTAGHQLQQASPHHQLEVEQRVVHQNQSPSSFYAAVPTDSGQPHRQYQAAYLLNLAKSPSHDYEDETSDDYDSRDDSSSSDEEDNETPPQSLIHADLPEAARGLAAHMDSYQDQHPKKSVSSKASPSLTTQPHDKQSRRHRLQATQFGEEFSTSNLASGKAISHRLGPTLESSDSVEDDHQGSVNRSPKYPTQLHNATMPAATMLTSLPPNAPNQLYYSEPPQISESATGQGQHNLGTSTEMEAISGSTQSSHAAQERQIQPAVAPSFHKNDDVETKNAGSRVNANPTNTATGAKSLILKQTIPGRLPRRIPKQRSQTYPKSRRIFNRNDFEPARNQYKATPSTPIGGHSRQLPLPPIKETSHGSGASSRVERAPGKEAPPVLPSKPLPPIAHQTQSQSQCTPGTDATTGRATFHLE